MTNLIFTTFLYLTAFESGELKTEYGYRAEYIMPSGYGAGLQFNDHGRDSFIDGIDAYAIRQWRIGRFKPGVFAGAGSNIEDQRLRASAGVRLDFDLSKRVTLQLSAAAQREWGEWKGEDVPMSAVFTLGAGWRF